MVASQIGDRIARVRKVVEVECKRDNEHVPIPYLRTVEGTAALWDLTMLPENAIFRNVQVTWTVACFLCHETPLNFILLYPY